MRTRELTTEDKILKAAEEEFMQKGYAAARTTEIARKAGVGHPLLHYYFKTKEQLFETVFKNKITFFAQSLFMVFSLNKGNIVERISEIIERHFEFLEENPLLPSFIINAINEKEDILDNVKKEPPVVFKKMIDIIQEELDKAHEKGEIIQMDARILLFDAFCLNISAFVAMPILSPMVQTVGLNVADILKIRKQENIELIKRRILR